MWSALASEQGNRDTSSQYTSFASSLSSLVDPTMEPLSMSYSSDEQSAAQSTSHHLYSSSHNQLTRHKLPEVDIHSLHTCSGITWQQGGCRKGLQKKKAEAGPQQTEPVSARCLQSYTSARLSFIQVLSAENRHLPVEMAYSATLIYKPHSPHIFNECN